MKPAWIETHWLPDGPQAVAADNAAIKNGALPTALMEEAGRGMTELLLSRFPANSFRFLIVAGPGNNGGDGYVVGRLLRERSASVTLVAPGGDPRTETAKLMERRFREEGGEVLSACQDAPAQGPTVVIDALLGVGSAGVLRGAIQEGARLINRLAEQGCSIVSLDLPTGINPSTGEVDPDAVRAALTLTVQFIKRGMLQFPAREHCGELLRVPIGIAAQGPAQYLLLDPAAAPRLKRRPPNSHKGVFGRVLVVGGSQSMPGAAQLTARAALRSGAAIVSVIDGGTSIDWWPELIRVPVHWEEGALGISSSRALLAACDSASVAVVGPGLGSASDALLQLFFREAERRNLPLVIDADALKPFLRYRGVEGAACSDLHLSTPHPGEGAALLGVSTGEFQRDRYDAGTKLQNLLGGTVVVKGAQTIVQHRGHGAVVDRSDPNLATAGSGDVLAGIAAGLVAQGLSCEKAGELAVLVHLDCAAEAAGRSGGTIIASDLIEEIPRTLSRYRL